LEKALIQIYLPSELCPLAGTFWEKNFPARARVPLESFIQKFCKTLASKNPVHTGCLKQLLTEEDGDEKVISIERFSAMLKWFGKMKVDHYTIIDRVADVMSKNWFFGPIAAKDAEDRLKLYNKKPGCFLVRLNMGGGTPIETSPFSISRVAEDGKVVHTRVYPREKSGLMIQYGKGKDQNKIRNKSQNLVDFINIIKSKEAKLLTEACPGWPYEDIFAKGPRPKSAYEEASDDE